MLELGRAEDQIFSRNSPGLHEDSSKVDLSMEVNVQHLLQVVLMSAQIKVHAAESRLHPNDLPNRMKDQWGASTFSPMDTPPEVMMTSARLIPSWRADSRSSGLWGTKTCCW